MNEQERKLAPFFNRFGYHDSAPLPNRVYMWGKINKAWVLSGFTQGDNAQLAALEAARRAPAGIWGYTTSTGRFYEVSPLPEYVPTEEDMSPDQGDEWGMAKYFGRYMMNIGLTHPPRTGLDSLSYSISGYSQARFSERQRAYRLLKGAGLIK